MDTIELGHTGLHVSRLALGCGSFGGIGSPAALIGHGLDEAAAFATMDEAVALGITLFDTAHSYAGGASEAMIGRWLARQPDPLRRRLHLCTKLGNVVSAQGVRVDLSPANLARQLDASLERLGVAHVDLCMSHAPDDGTPIAATLEGFAALIEAGKVSAIGACNVTATQLDEALATSERLRLPRYEWVQNAYNLMQRGDEARLFPLCREHGLGITPYSPVAGGILTGKYARNARPPEGSRLSLRPDGVALAERDFAAIDELVQCAEAHGTTAGALALAWVIGHPQIASAIAGPARHPHHLQLLNDALQVSLGAAERERIAGFFPT